MRCGALGRHLMPWIFATVSLATPAASADRVTPWPNSPAARAEAGHRLQRLELLLITEPSATAVLQSWCETYRIAPGARIVAERPPMADKPPPDQVRQTLAVSASDIIRYRHVRLLCGGHLLSEADNWYVADRLTGAMNAQLDHTDTPFGRAIKALHFRRTTLSSRLSWSATVGIAPGEKAIAFPIYVITNEAVLHSQTGLPIAQVVERYTAGVLGAPPAD
jgi:chorismate-pyruvate lyase